MADQELRLAKYFIAGVSFILLALGGGVWPFIWWEMYSSGNRTPQPRISRLELHVRDSDGQQHVLRPMDLYTLDDDSSSQPAGHQLVQRAVIGTDEQKAIYRPYLAQRLEFLLDIQIEQVEAWNYFWDVDYEQHPPIGIDQPTQTVLIERFNADSFDSVLSR